MHRQEEQVGRAKQAHRLVVGQVTVQADGRGAVRDAAVGVRDHARQVDLEPGGELRLGRAHALDRLEQVDVRARQDVEPSRGPAEQALGARAAPLS